MVKLYEDLALFDRSEQIKAEAVKVEILDFEKPLSDDDCEKLYGEQRELVLRLFKLEKKKKKFMNEYNNERKPVEMKHKEILQSMDTRTISIEGEVYLVPDFERRIMNYVDIEGNIINSRAMTKEEMQLSIDMTPIADLKIASNG